VRVALIGDSHSQAIWPRLSPLLISLGHDVVMERAEAGWSAKSYRDEGRLHLQLIEASPEIVIIELGANNFDFSDSYLENLRYMVEAAKQAGARKVLWFGPATVDSKIAPEHSIGHIKTAEMQSSFLPSMKTKWFDSQPWTLRDHGSDGVHFTNAGYDSWTNHIFRSFQENSAALPIAVWIGGGSLLSLLVYLIIRKLR
jgi:lysophospholipase L1-like esterase